MIRSALYRSVSVLLWAILISSCSDGAFKAPTAPVDAIAAKSAGASDKGPNLGRLPFDQGNVELKALWWKKKHNSGGSVSQLIGPSGGTIEMPANGLTIVFPAGALKDTKTITVTPDDKYVAYKMEPSGTLFLKDVSVTQLLDGIQIPALPQRSQLYAAYIADDNAKLVGKIPVLEIEPSSAILSPATGRPQAQVWIIRHFSRYMLASD